MRKLYIGLISGTSMDGIDCALIDTANHCQLVASYCQPIPAELKNTLWQLIRKDDITDPRIATVDQQLGILFAQAVEHLLAQTTFKPSDIKAIGSHGQNISHHPNDTPAYSLQIANPQIIADETGIITVADFRSADVAAGGQGAPLAPLFHDKILRSAHQSRAIINIGGIANVTFLSNKTNKVIGFDTGPGNGLMDAWCKQHTEQEYDADGAWAATGTVDQTLLQRLQSDAYFQKVGPKSTGKEYFNLAWLKAMLNQQSPEDVQATLLELTAQSIITSVQQHHTDAEMIVCGGGAHNKQLMQRLQHIATRKVIASSELGISIDYLEAMLFAWLAQQRLAKKTMDTSRITGAKQPVLLGQIFLPTGH